MIFMKIKRALKYLFLISCFAGSSTPFASANQTNSVQIIIDDMTLPPDAALHGVPANFSWGSGVAQPQPISVPAKNGAGQWWRAITAWGQAYLPVEGSAATNTRCQIRNLQTRVLLKNGVWKTVQSSVNPEGHAFFENFTNDLSVNAGERDESKNGGGISVKVGIGKWAGHNYHFWPVGSRPSIDPDNLVGIFTACEARLIVDDPALPDDRSSCSNLLQMGADWWIHPSAHWTPDWLSNSGIAGGRSKWITTNWQSFNMCTMLPANILNNPPVEDTGKSFSGSQTNLDASSGTSISKSHSTLNKSK